MDERKKKCHGDHVLGGVKALRGNRRKSFSGGRAITSTDKSERWLSASPSPEPQAPFLTAGAAAKPNFPSLAPW